MLRHFGEVRIRLFSAWKVSQRMVAVQEVQKLMISAR